MNHKKPLYTTIIASIVFGNIVCALSLQETTFNNVDFVVVEVSSEDPLRLYWKQPNVDQAYQSLNNLVKTLAKQKTDVLFAINSGIFSKDQKPLGWHVEQSERLQPLNLVKRKDAIGNFSLIPNGVFFIDKNNQRYVMETETFLKQQQSFNVTYATQSGPMLIIDGQLHPKFYPSSDSLKYRSGVCVKDNSTYFAVTQNPINFYYFAKFFQTELKCTNALYLDGTLSQLYYKGRIYGAPFWNIRPYVGIWATTLPQQ